MGQLERTTCATCGNVHEGLFCNLCGQRQRKGRLTFAQVSRGAVRAFFDSERGLLHTVKQLFRAPAKVAHDFIDGATARYVNPFKYFLLTVTAAQLVAWQIGVLRDMVRGFMDGADDLVGSFTADQITDFVTSNFILLAALAIPGLVLFARVFFRSSRFNSSEILAFFLYLFGHLSLIFVLVAPFASLLPSGPEDSILVAMMVGQMVFSVWATVRFFRAPALSGAARAILVFILAFIAQGVLLAILTGIAAAIAS